MFHLQCLKAARNAAVPGCMRIRGSPQCMSCLPPVKLRSSLPQPDTVPDTGLDTSGASADTGGGASADPSIQLLTTADLAELKAARGGSSSGEPSLPNSDKGESEGEEEGEEEEEEGETVVAGACLPICGDGLVRGSEVCDDGNTDGDDGCACFPAAGTRDERCSCSPPGTACVCFPTDGPPPASTRPICPPTILPSILWYSNTNDYHNLLALISLPPCPHRDTPP